MEDRRGYFIVIEGIDGSGKSTLARAVGAELERRGIPTVVSREPTDGPYGRKIREIARTGREGITPLEEADLFIADREEHVRDVILPALKTGKAVVLDRYYYSTLAYQGARGMNVAELIERHRRFAPEPDLLVILKIKVDTALERIRQSRGNKTDHFEEAQYLASVALIFDHLEHPNLLNLDATEPTARQVEVILHAADQWVSAVKR